MAKKKITIENLATMVNKGFDDTAKKIDERVNHLRQEMNERFDEVDNHLYNLEKDAAEIKKHFVYRYEFEDLVDRVRKLEKRLAMKGGR